MSDILLEARENGVLWLTLNRPERKNAISPDLREALLGSLEAARADDEVRCVVVAGAGDAFCAGVDLGASKVTGPAAAGRSATGSGAGPAPAGSQPQARRRDPRAVRESMRGGFQRVIRAIWDLDKPVLASVNGVAAGGGAQLALVCDLVIAAESARLIEVFVRRGLAVDSGGGWLLPRLVGLQKAKELIFFGDPLGAREALALGLVNRVVPDGELEAATREWAERLARGPTRAIGGSKALLNRSFDQDLAAGLEDEAAVQALVSFSEDFTEGVRAFMEKRDPEFKGR